MRLILENMVFRKFFVYTLLICYAVVSSQNINSSKVYKNEREKVNNLVHTKLMVNFNFQKKELNGEEWVTLSPHFYPTSKVVLDAKAMVIKTITLDNNKLDYIYNGYKLIIQLPKEYKKDEEYTLYIKYIARPEKVKDKASIAISAAKGLYFINSMGKNPKKPTQIWTQGETESSSCWFPTIDAPNQKTSQEIYITVPENFQTLSNGELVSQTKSGKSRTDYWKFSQKHAPYLFFMGVGEYEIIKDSYKNIPINYYVEKTKQN